MCLTATLMLSRKTKTPGPTQVSYLRAICKTSNIGPAAIVVACRLTLNLCTKQHLISLDVSTLLIFADQRDWQCKLRQISVCLMAQYFPVALLFILALNCAPALFDSSLLFASLALCVLVEGYKSSERKQPAHNEPSSPASVSLPHNNVKVSHPSENVYANLPA